MHLLRAPFTARAWRELAYVLTGLPVSTAVFCVLVTLVATSAGLLVTFLGIPLLAATLLVARGVGAAERARARWLLGLHVPGSGALPPGVRGASLTAGTAAVLRNGTSWRNLLYGLVSFPWSVFSFCTGLTVWSAGWGMATYPLWSWSLPEPGAQLGENSAGEAVYVDAPLEVAAFSAAGMFVVLVVPWWLRGLTAVDRMLVKGLLGPSRLTERVQRLEAGRAVVTDTASADLRRIERDLHDGAQARLVALAMDLGLAREKLTEDPETAARMVDEAHGEVKLALQELRDLARGIHPAILTDRGLGPALATLTNRCTIPVTLTTDLPQRPAPAIEAIAYFTVSELLQNISKHSNAHHATIDIWRTTDRLLLHVTDNGQGGATPHPGTGLAGLTERLTSVDGQLLIHSPTGGPTTITAELPWRARDVC
ncbi:sensor domain-containing protein [Streptomyces sp. TRM 70351]|uniref:sensor histidine kinase n=1 Tax=Streptomyces sp. TRM 70351 TaxID=3116552 RepID=UPI002E7B44CF|nr:sensor domain-containing protein [Streptomyces sp. TRM 70351]MEE1930962.1 sensor domain-containing protein [Streptomyces sp. TRM 70351]